MPEILYQQVGGCAGKNDRARIVLREGETLQGSLLGEFASEAGPRPSDKPWSQFVIWGAGRDGRALYAALSTTARARVVCMCDIDPKKVGRDYHHSRLECAVLYAVYTSSSHFSVNDCWCSPPNRIPVVHHSALERKSIDGKSMTAKLPVVVCVTRRRKFGAGNLKADSKSNENFMPDGQGVQGGDGALEENVQRLKLQEGVDLWYFV